jgi:hypothetical protein
MHFFRVVALVIHARACFERFWPEMERNARDCVLLAVCWVCSDVRLRVINFISPGVKHDASIGTCYMIPVGVGDIKNPA